MNDSDNESDVAALAEDVEGNDFSSSESDEDDYESNDNKLAQEEVDDEVDDNESDEEESIRDPFEIANADNEDDSMACELREGITGNNNDTGDIADSESSSSGSSSESDEDEGDDDDDDDDDGGSEGERFSPKPPLSGKPLAMLKGIHVNSDDENNDNNEEDDDVDGDSDSADEEEDEEGANQNGTEAASSSYGMTDVRKNNHKKKGESAAFASPAEAIASSEEAVVVEAVPFSSGHDDVVIASVSAADEAEPMVVSAVEVVESGGDGNGEGDGGVEAAVVEAVIVQDGDLSGRSNKPGKGKKGSKGKTNPKTKTNTSKKKAKPSSLSSTKVKSSSKGPSKAAGSKGTSAADSTREVSKRKRKKTKKYEEATTIGDSMAVVAADQHIDEELSHGGNSEAPSTRKKRKYTRKSTSSEKKLGKSKSAASSVDGTVDVVVASGKKKLKENKRLSKQEQANHRRKLKAAAEARELLKSTVTQVPIALGGILVRKFGNIYVDPPDQASTTNTEGGANSSMAETSASTSGGSNNTSATRNGSAAAKGGASSSGANSSGMGINVREEKYSNARALHPVGFSADWFVHSPVHNRAIQCRCDILRGMGGPLFRVRWGKGLDQTDAASALALFGSSSAGGSGSSDGVLAVEPFDMEKSTPILLGDAFDASGNKSKKKKAPFAPGKNMQHWQYFFDNKDGRGKQRKPAVGMRIKVRFDDNPESSGATQRDNNVLETQSSSGGWYEGTVVGVTHRKFVEESTYGDKKPSTTHQYTLQIEYDNGEVEEETYPGDGIQLFTDQDLLEQVTVQPPEDEKGKKGTMDSGNKSSFVSASADQGIHTVYGKSPLEAWGKVLTNLGLIDEVIAEHAFDALMDVRKRSLKQAKERLKNLQLQRKHAKIRHKQRQLGMNVPTGQAVDDANGGEGEATTDNIGNSAESSALAKIGDPSPSSNLTMNEEELQAKFDRLLKKYNTMKREAEDTKSTLCSARINAMGPFLQNPFHDASQKQQENWLTAVIRKEKAKMGSTGNKRKILNSADLLNRMDTFFNNDIEALVEGLPGSELCPNYVFRACRGSSGSSVATTQAWVQEAHIKAEQERDRQRKLAREEKIRQKEEQEREERRKLKEAELERKKQQKIDEEMSKRKARIDERLQRLNVQVEERLFKEALIQRERVVMAAQRSIVREWVRRRGVADKVAGFVVEQGFVDDDNNLKRIESTETVSSITTMPHRSNFSAQRYDKNVLRLWDFMHSFKNALTFDPVAKATADDSSEATPAGPSIPGADEMQEAINVLRTRDKTLDQVDDNNSQATKSLKECEEQRKKEREAVQLLTRIGMTLCRPLASNLTKMLSASVNSSAAAAAAAAGSTAGTTTALNPMDPNIVKVKGAGADGESGFGSDSDSDESDQLLVELPVTDVTWTNVARLAIMADALMEGLLFTKMDCANVLRGYRSGGHPNSREAQRLRKQEETAFGKLRQALLDQSVDMVPCLVEERDKLKERATSEKAIVVKIAVPSTPSAVPEEHWSFYLHNCKALPPNASGAGAALKENIQKALDMLVQRVQEDKVAPGEKKFVSELRHICKLLDSSSSGGAGGGAAAQAGETERNSKVTKAVMKVLEKVTDERFLKHHNSPPIHKDSSSFNNTPNSADDQDEKDDYQASVSSVLALRRTCQNRPPRRRLRMGLISSLSVSRREYKELMASREDYMATALKKQLKREQAKLRQEKAQKGGEQEEEEEEEEDDEEEEDENSDDEDEEIRKSAAENKHIKTKDTKTDDGTTSEVSAASVQSVGAANKKNSNADLDDTTNEKCETESSSLQNPDDGKNAEEEKMYDEEKTTPTEEVNSAGETISDRTGNKKATSEATGTVETKEEEVPYDPQIHPIGRATPYDEFCADNPKFPELIRRCLAIVRSLCLTESAPTFIYPIDPQTSPRYYETVTRPMCLQDVGVYLTKQGKRLIALMEKRDEMMANMDSEGASTNIDIDAEVASVVAQFARDVRLIAANSVTYSVTGAALISQVEQLMRIFERLLMDWVLCPPSLLAKLEDLDDDKCVDHHESDMTALILICDRCEGKFNTSRLVPALTTVPKGDWFCPRCVGGRCWAHIDPRIGRKVLRTITVSPSIQSNDVADGDEMKDENTSKTTTSDSSMSVEGIIRSVHSAFLEDTTSKQGSRLVYTIHFPNSGMEESWSLDEVEAGLTKYIRLNENSSPLPHPILCEEALAECPGYGTGRDMGMGEIVPVAMDPHVSDAAAQAMLSSSVFKKSVESVALLGLANGPEEMTADEWLAILCNLSMKCALSEPLQQLASQKESHAAAKLSRKLKATAGKSKTLLQVLPKLPEDEEGEGGGDDLDDIYNVDDDEDDATGDDKGSTTGGGGGNNDDADGEEQVPEGEEDEDGDDTRSRGANDQDSVLTTTPDSLKSGTSKKSPKSLNSSSGRGKKRKRKEVLFGDEDSSEDEDDDGGGGNDDGTEGEEAEMTLNEDDVDDGNDNQSEGPLKKKMKSSGGDGDDAEKSRDGPESGNGDALGNSGSPATGPEAVPSKAETMTRLRTMALARQGQRQRMREDGYLAMCLKTQLRPMLASLEEDTVTPIIHQLLEKQPEGLDLDSCLVPQDELDFEDPKMFHPKKHFEFVGNSEQFAKRYKVCDLCRLSDVALGSPLMRVPNKEEWTELMAHQFRHRRTRMIAEIPMMDRQDPETETQLSSRNETTLQEDASKGGADKHIPGKCAPLGSRTMMLNPTKKDDAHQTASAEDESSNLQMAESQSLADSDDINVLAATAASSTPVKKKEDGEEEKANSKVDNITSASMKEDPQQEQKHNQQPPQDDDDDDDQPNVETMLVAVSVRVGGKLVSDDENKDEFKDLAAHGMLELIPRNPMGAQEELRYRSDHHLNVFVTGSLSVHECCASSAHNARRDVLLKKHKEHIEQTLEQNLSRTVGKTVPIGGGNLTDAHGRTYWKFIGDPQSLFVWEQQEPPQQQIGPQNDNSHNDMFNKVNNKSNHLDTNWIRYKDPEQIASVIVELLQQSSTTSGGNHNYTSSSRCKVRDLAEELKRQYPQATKLIKDGTWSSLLQRKRWSHIFDKLDDNDEDHDKENDGEDDDDNDEVKTSKSKTETTVNKKKQAGGSPGDPPLPEGTTLIPADEMPYEEGEDILVESKSQQLLWDAVVVAQSHDTTHKTKVNGYRVHYKQWSTRFDEWVAAERVVEPSDHNLEVQEELLEERTLTLDETCVPPALQTLVASKFYRAKRRAKGATFLPSVALQDALRAPSNNSPSSEQMMSILKASLLLIEAALPLGSIDTTDEGAWNRKSSLYWKFLVEHSPGPSTLMGCTILLQDAISKAWFRPRGIHLMECLPMCYRATEEATLGSIATRIYILDRSILYGLVSHADPAKLHARARASSEAASSVGGGGGGNNSSAIGNTTTASGGTAKSGGGRRSAKTGRFISTKDT